MLVYVAHVYIARAVYAELWGLGCFHGCCLGKEFFGRVLQNRFNKLAAGTTNELHSAQRPIGSILCHIKSIDIFIKYKLTPSEADTKWWMKARVRAYAQLGTMLKAVIHDSRFSFSLYEFTSQTGADNRSNNAAMLTAKRKRNTVLNFDRGLCSYMYMHVRCDVSKTVKIFELELVCVRAAVMGHRSSTHQLTSRLLAYIPYQRNHTLFKVHRRQLNETYLTQSGLMHY